MQPDLNRFTRCNHPENIRGMTLMEVVVALFIFSVGAIGYNHMQSGLFHQRMDNQQRSLALWKAEELIDLISSNNSSSALQQYADAVSNADICSVEPANDCIHSAGSTVAPNCSASELVDYDVWRVLCNADTGLTENMLEFSATLSCNNVCGDDAGMTLQYRWLSAVIDSDKELRSVKLSEEDGGGALSEDKLTLVFQP